MPYARENTVSISILGGNLNLVLVVAGPGSSSGKAMGYGLDGPGLILGVGEVEIFLRSFMSKLVLRSTQPPIK